MAQDSSIESTNGKLALLSLEELVKLKKASDGLKGMSIAWTILCAAVAALAVMAIFSSKPHNGITSILVLTTLASLALAYGLLHREDWAQTVGFIIFGLLCLAFPVGTIIGGLGIYRLVNSKNLFGADAPTHDEITQAVKNAKSQAPESA